MGARILVADDSVTIQKVVELTFSREDYELIPARSGEEAIRKAREMRPDLMLIDLVMPDKNGYEVCRTLREDPLLRTTPIILLAGTFETFDKGEGLKVGANDFVTKPFESQTLIGKVKQLLAGQGASAAAPAALAAAPAVLPIAPVLAAAATSATAPTIPVGPPPLEKPAPAPVFALREEPVAAALPPEGQVDISNIEIILPGQGGAQPIAAIERLHQRQQGMHSGGVRPFDSQRQVDLGRGFDLECFTVHVVPLSRQALHRPPVKAARLSYPRRSRLPPAPRSPTESRRPASVAASYGAD